MATADSAHCRYEQDFDAGNPVGERGARAVIFLSLVMMIGELFAGWLFGSLALLADGWHMATHVAAIGLAAAAYYFARHYARDTRFAFGTWKIEVLGGFTSAIILSIVAIGMIVESVQRLATPQEISYRESLVVAAIGLVVNLFSIWFLHSPSSSHDSEGHHVESCDHHATEDHHDLNLRAAMMHLVSDALTSVLAIAALLGGWWLGWQWLDPATGFVGAGVILIWSVGLTKSTARILLDCEMDHPIVGQVRNIASHCPGVEICDLHLWRVGRKKYACIVSIVVDDLQTAQEFRRALGEHPELGHITIEVFGRSENTYQLEKNS